MEDQLNTNRSALWALLGVLVGFSLPIVACIGITLFLSIGLAGLGNPTTPSPISAVHTSGPLDGPAVAIIEITGPIVSGRVSPLASTDSAAAADIMDQIQQAALDSDVRAIILYVNSPGGGVVPSDEIYTALQQLRIPIIVQMGDVVASGAYYLSMAADHLIANPNTLTGSIGVVSTFPDAHELLEKVGVEMNVITAGEVKDFGSPYREMSPAEQAYWEELINEVYLEFIEIVAEGRGFDEETAGSIADGRVYSGRRALELGLVDAVGYQRDAIDKAVELAGITGEPRVIRYQKFSTLSSLLGETISSLPTGLPPDLLQRALSPMLEYRWLP
jgi:protease-4